MSKDELAVDPPTAVNTSVPDVPSALDAFGVRDLVVHADPGSVIGAAREDYASAAARACTDAWRRAMALMQLRDAVLVDHPGTTVGAVMDGIAAALGIGSSTGYADLRAATATTEEDRMVLIGAGIGPGTLVRLWGTIWDHRGPMIVAMLAKGWRPSDITAHFGNELGPQRRKPNTGKPNTGKPNTGQPNTGQPDTGKSAPLQPGLAIVGEGGNVLDSTGEGAAFIGAITAWLRLHPHHAGDVAAVAVAIDREHQARSTAVAEGNANRKARALQS